MKELDLLTWQTGLRDNIKQMFNYCRLIAKRASHRFGQHLFEPLVLHACE